MTTAVRNPAWRQSAWEAMRALRLGFTVADLAIHRRPRAKSVIIPPDSLALYVRTLAKAGIVERIDTRGGKHAARYRLVKDGGIEPPRLRADGTVNERRSAFSQMWTAMRHLREFTAFDLAVFASIAELRISAHTSLRYCRFLVRAGYLDIIERGGRIGARNTAFRFVQGKYTGPAAPVIAHALVLFDPNIGQIVWRPEIAA
jgi:hypothetical protein